MLSITLPVGFAVAISGIIFMSAGFGRVHTRLYYALALLLIGTTSFIFRHSLPVEPWVSILLSGVAITVGYFLVLIDTYRRRGPVMTRGGLLKFEKNPVQYRILFGFLTFIGLLNLFAFLAF